jgi:hypothetical protein
MRFEVPQPFLRASKRQNDRAKPPAMITDPGIERESL